MGFMSIVKYPKLYEQEKSIKKHVFTIVPTPAVALSVGQVNVLAADKNQVSGREADKATNLFEPKSVVSCAEGAAVTKRFIELVNEAVF